jgi:hypothetical protein
MIKHLFMERKMATRKKKTEVVETAPKARTKTKKTTIVETITYPRTVKGTHLTVIDHAPGRTELIWDDEQLLKEVREAIASVE